MKAIRERKEKSAIWNDDFYVKAYRLAAGGATEKDIAAALGVSYKAMRVWRRSNPNFDKCIKDGKKSISGDRKEETFAEYVYNRLDSKLRKVWDRIHKAEREKDYGVAQELLRGLSTKVRQNLFVHAIIHYNFNVNRACMAVRVPYTCFRRWARMDAGFKELLQSMFWHRKNFLEGALMKLVRDGDTGAIIFANKTLNADRGYNEKVQIDVKVEDKRTTDMLPLALKQQLLEALREAKRNEDNEGIIKIGHKEEIPDAEFEVVKKSKKKKKSRHEEEE